MRTQNGFTLVEILVVISIIALMSSILYVAFDGAREQTRTKALQTNLKQVQLAAEVYKAQNDRYPAALTDLVPEYIGEIPVSGDSNNPNCAIQYFTDAGGTRYKLTAFRCFEGAENASEGIGEDEEFSRCPSSCANCGGVAYDETQPEFYESMAVYSFGAQCE